MEDHHKKYKNELCNYMKFTGLLPSKRNGKMPLVYGIFLKFKQKQYSLTSVNKKYDYLVN